MQARREIRMLSNDEENDLIKLAEQFPKYAHIIRDAIQGWKSSVPRTNSYGIDLTGDTILPGTENCTCFLGAALLGKIKSSQDSFPCDEVEYHFKISITEIFSIVRGFDGKSLPYDGNSEAYSLGNKVRYRLYYRL